MSHEGDGLLDSAFVACESLSELVEFLEHVVGAEVTKHDSVMLRDPLPGEFFAGLVLSVREINEDVGVMLALTEDVKRVLLHALAFRTAEFLGLDQLQDER